MRLLLVWLINALSLLAVPYVLPSVSIASFYAALITALVLGLLNTLVRPVLKLITLPLILITFGLFTVIINAALLILAAQLTGLIIIGSVSALLWATLIISLVHIIFDPKS